MAIDEMMADKCSQTKWQDEVIVEKYSVHEIFVCKITVVKITEGKRTTKIYCGWNVFRRNDSRWNYSRWNDRRWYDGAHKKWH